MQRRSGSGFFFYSWLTRVLFGNALLWLVVLGALIVGVFAVFVLAGLQLPLLPDLRIAAGDGRG